MMVTNARDSEAKEQVAIGLLRDEEQTLFVRVQVRSRLKPKSLMSGDLDSREFKSQADVREKVKVLAGALGELVRDQLRDKTVHPDHCAEEAVKLWDQMLKMKGAEVLPI